MLRILCTSNRKYGSPNCAHKRHYSNNRRMLQDSFLSQRTLRGSTRGCQRRGDATATSICMAVRRSLIGIILYPFGSPFEMSKASSTYAHDGRMAFPCCVRFIDLYSIVMYIFTCPSFVLCKYVSNLQVIIVLHRLPFFLDFVLPTTSSPPYNTLGDSVSRTPS